MADALKHVYSRDLLTAFSMKISTVYPDFDKTYFLTAIFNQTWEKKELKQRMRHITECLRIYLPNEYRAALAVLDQVATECHGLAYMFFPDFVECYGLKDWNASLPALARYTHCCSSEFAVRPFIIQDSTRMMQCMTAWASSEDEHLRRLASEGCRPRLPWAMALPEFKRDPSAILPILEQLKADPSEYVRRSVANNLNDISKDHPDKVLKIAEKWQGDNPSTNWIIKHACRGLLKQGHPRALALFGWLPATHVQIKNFTITTPEVKQGERLEFSFDLHSTLALGRLRLEYGIDFMKANGQQRRKIFKISEADYQQSTKNIQRYFSFKPISTRRYYLGAHKLVLIINGQVCAEQVFSLQA